MLYGKSVLITGASSGIGKACAEYLKDQGYHVYGTSRHGDGSIITNDKNGGFLNMLRMDVQDDEMVNEVVKYIADREGTVDIAINCAGYGLAGAVEDTSPQEAMDEFNTNFFGVLRVCRAVLPYMRAKGNGLIINISSVAGFIAIPYQSMYSASKYALEALSQAMRIEVKPFGIKVTLIEPGDIRTGFTSSRIWTKAAKGDTPYKERCQRAIESMEKSEMNGPGPEIVVKAVAKVIESKNPPIREVVGAEYKLIAFLRRIAPDRLIEYVVTKMYS
ncbi:MAG TPA: SDR family oxidoreductase [Dictyoglomaceae bacterium]|nr:SDR family oxidoreductase [Dictyoglomaceae bacterium]HOL39870.1 SDR family oxidoreductase [Dictyoglomaceae bacterium]HOP95561.1 SDR family oxidoreductase [Dictyoglomaceae bacterium]HOP95733.1 SDR family oxidoreductase [Dictyoglomaceae bacterium]HPP16335.1 SDR family oxidoreductase [Dictyoglomaceae bacterium]